ncbi:hypothetical protein K435DRAFT_726946 [Dendrothele bispora CBS 962.96]|uniref:DUF6534 domain-containing protein n=1 Tax=Dendrothele bispora (strain CBS 962.96) TaxID=1314807 RepID=A0A4S8LR60_DENBC|nr:hypothetical protein K435DRAFT_726946 [Dendrothele bispora CBS 962.96]
MSFLLGAMDLNTTLGAVLVGGLVSIALWGMTCVQSYNFFMAKTKDGLALKLMVAFLWVLDTLDAVLTCHVLYYYCVSSFMDPLKIIVPTWSAVIHVATTCTITFIIRSMFLIRVYRLSKHNILITSIITLISLASLVSGYMVTVEAFSFKTYFELSKISSVIYVALASGAASDFSLAIVQCILLYRSRTGFKRTNSLISTLMLYAINTGFVVMMDSSSVLITYAVMPTNFIFLGLYLPTPKLYLNTYLAHLNARQSIQDQLHRRSRPGFSHSYALNQTSQTVPWNSIPGDVIAISVDKVVEQSKNDSDSTSPSVSQNKGY